MTNLPPLDISSILRKYALHPSKGLGQNFLTDEASLQQIVSIAEITPLDHVLEIGPGLGSLTRHLAGAAHSVTAVELDTRLFPALTAILSSFKNIRLVQGDILELDPAALVDGSDFLVVANIPYYITSAVIRHLLESRLHPKRIVLTVQQEVARRICAQPGEMSLLALSVQVYGQPRNCAHIPSTAFFPTPNVDSSVLSVEIYPQPVIPVHLLNTFFSLAKAGFSQRRKTLRNSLSAGMRMSPAWMENLLSGVGIDPQRRAETLDLTEWGNLSERYTAVAPG
jgi:16S rRNA (adenine1518-N6/adenine1519-N6)-dimethyltransferase